MRSTDAIVPVCAGAACEKPAYAPPLPAPVLLPWFFECSCLLFIQLLPWYHIRSSCYTTGMSKTFWAILAAIILICGGIIFFKGDKADAPSSGTAATNHVTGQGKSGVTLVEYGDFQCPFCGQYYPLVQAVKEKYDEQIHFQFRHLPLIQSHKNAFAAARAAEAAGNQDKFWEMYDLLFQNQTTWADSTTASTVFEGYASQLGLNLAKFKADVASNATNDRINADVSEFKKTKERISTPTFFLEGKKIQPTSVEAFSDLIDQAIKAKTKQ